MTSLAARLARPAILGLPDPDIAAQADDLFGPEAIKLDANENPFPPLLGGSFLPNTNRYPEPRPAGLGRALAALYGVPPENLVVTRGADDAIEILIRTFCRPDRDSISICPPTFSAYGQFARLQGAKVVEIPLLPDFDFDAEAFIAGVRADRSIKLAFLCSPSNPTGNVINPADVLRVADALPDTIIVLDEAYLEFSETPSLTAEAAARENLAILKTLSKAYGLAGARVGAAIGNAELVALAARALPPYPLPSLSIDAAMATLSPSRRPLHQERIERLKAERDRLAGHLATSPLVRRVRNGGGNFLFLEVDDPAGLARTLLGLGIRARFRPNAAPGGVRLSIGTDSENEAALSAFGVPSSRRPDRVATFIRDTKETRIAVGLNLDSPEPRTIDTGIPFFDHMLDQVAAHGGFALTLTCEGDVEIDAHHSLEDCALALGGALSEALADRRGIGRFGFALPMDETEAQVLIDLSGRPYSLFEGAFEASHVGAYPTEMTSHIFRSIADGLGAAIHVRVSGNNDHHKTEACFKAFGRALRQALAIGASPGELPSTKGVL